MKAQLWLLTLGPMIFAIGVLVLAHLRIGFWYQVYGTSHALLTVVLAPILCYIFLVNCLYGVYFAYFLLLYTHFMHLSLATFT